MSEETPLFQKKDIIFSSTMGVCKVLDVPSISANKADYYRYYCLVSIFNDKKKAYIPTEKHSVTLRPLISLEEAKKLKENGYSKLELIYQQEVDYVIEQAEKTAGK